MCYFVKVVWACGHWKWGRLVHRGRSCYPVGGTPDSACGESLVFTVVNEATECDVCRFTFNKEIQLEMLQSRIERLLSEDVNTDTLDIGLLDMDKLYQEMRTAPLAINNQGLITDGEEDRSRRRDRTGAFRPCYWCGVQFYRDDLRVRHVLTYHTFTKGQGPTRWS